LGVHCTVVRMRALVARHLARLISKLPITGASSVVYTTLDDKQSQIQRTTFNPGLPFRLNATFPTVNEPLYACTLSNALLNIPAIPLFAMRILVITLFPFFLCTNSSIDPLPKLEGLLPPLLSSTWDMVDLNCCRGASAAPLPLLAASLAPDISMTLT
jgi:hypothetical protein